MPALNFHPRFAPGVEAGTKPTAYWDANREYGYASIKEAVDTCGLDTVIELIPIYELPPIRVKAVPRGYAIVK